MKYETQYACAWFSKQLDDTVSHEQRKRFEASLQSGLCNHYAAHWYEDYPSKGQGFRSLTVDVENQFVDELILAACSSSGIVNFHEKISVPDSGFTMWVDPGEVEIKFFGTRRPMTIYTKLAGPSLDQPIPVARPRSPTRNAPRPRTPSPRSYSPPPALSSPPRSAYNSTPLFIPPQEQAAPQYASEWEMQAAYEQQQQQQLLQQQHQHQHQHQLQQQQQQQQQQQMLMASSQQFVDQSCGLSYGAPNAMYYQPTHAMGMAASYQTAF